MTTSSRSESAKKRFADKTKHPMYGRKHSEETRRKQSAKASQRTGEKGSNWRGGSMIIGGYNYILSPDHPNKTQMGYVAEHRLVMEKHIGRFLLRKEAVHHLNGNPLDNSIGNLVLFSNNGEHTAKEHVKKDPKTGRFISG